MIRFSPELSLTLFDLNEAGGKISAGDSRTDGDESQL
jgi:hypothetical protein